MTNKINEPKASGNSTARWGVDVGTGASCIYPLLSVARNPSWKFVATELDEESFKSAKSNIANNKLEDKIFLWKVNTTHALSSSTVRKLLQFAEEDAKIARFHFCMCNPPFYKTLNEVSQ